jgi:3alpha(or 20beta)-hydroxysteroid dehydrogenase
MGNRLRGKVALVTGAAEGLGEAIARAFVAEGAQVFLTDVQVDKGKALAKALGRKAAFFKLDVTSEQQWKRAFEAALKRFGQLNILVNNAGISEPGNPEDETFDHWKRVHAINLDSIFLGCKYGIAAIKANGEPGSIINMSSMLALRPGAFVGAYVSSKAAVMQYSKAVALHCAQTGLKIRCNTIHPGAIETPMFQRYLDASGLSHDEAYDLFARNHPMGRCGKPEEIAQAAVFLASDESSFTTGCELTVDGGSAIRDT